MRTNVSAGIVATCRTLMAGCRLSRLAALRAFIH